MPEAPVNYEVKPVTGFDIDNTLAEANRSIKPFNAEFLVGLKEHFNIVGILSSGKSVSYIEKEAKACDIGLWFAENNAVYQKKGEEPVIVGENIESLNNLRTIIGLGKDQEGVAKINLNGFEGEVAIEEGKFGVLTIFPELGPVKHRWNFQETYTRKQISEALNSIIKDKNLKLSVLGPHGDGAIDVVRLDRFNKPINKSSFSDLCKQLIDGKLNLAFFGDGNNDIPAWADSDVYGITFDNASEEAKRSIANKGEKGYTSSLDGPTGGVFEGIIYLANQEFFEKHSSNVRLYAKEFLNDLKKQGKIFY